MALGAFMRCAQCDWSIGFSEMTAADWAAELPGVGYLLAALKLKHTD